VTGQTSGIRKTPAQTDICVPREAVSEAHVAWQPTRGWMGPWGAIAAEASEIPPLCLVWPDFEPHMTEYRRKIHPCLARECCFQLLINESRKVAALR
jgi:hypothetical protein